MDILQRSIDEIMANLGDDMVFPEDLETKELRKIATAEGKLEEFEKRLAKKHAWRYLPDFGISNDNFLMQAAQG